MINKRIMTISENKLAIIELLLNTKKNVVLEQVRVILENQYDETNDGRIVFEPMNVDLYNKKLIKSEEDLINGNVISQKDLKKKYNIKDE